MTPIYFPFTYMPKSVSKVLSACFRQTAVYQISDTKIPDDMQELVRDGILGIRIPVEANGQFLDKVLEDYRTWIDTHQGMDTAVLKTMAHETPFFDESASSQIRADLKKAGKQAPAEKKPDLLFYSKLFLHMAQEFDLQKKMLDQDLMNIEAMEEDFMKDLKGEDDDDQFRATLRMVLKKDDPGHYMTKERINAWVSLMQQDPQISGLFVTTSRAVLEQLVDMVPEMEQVIRFDAVPMGTNDDETLSSWQDGLMETLENLATENWPAPMDDMPPPLEIPGSEKSVSITIYIVPNKTPHEYFANFVETDVFQDENSKTDTQFKNTLVGLVEKNG